MEYAEQTLAVHTLYEQALLELDRYEDARQSLAYAHAALRTGREELADHEANFTVTARGENADMSATAFDRTLKVLLQQDTTHRELRRKIIGLQGHVDLTEANMKTSERRIDITVARLHELAGLLGFYAARSPR